MVCVFNIHAKTRNYLDKIHHSQIDKKIPNPWGGEWDFDIRISLRNVSLSLFSITQFIPKQQLSHIK